MSRTISLAYPERGLIGRAFFPLIEPRTYLRIIHLLLMFPLGITYFIFFVTAFAFGGAMVWTFVGPPVLLLAMFVSLRLGDLEAWLVNVATRANIRRPPQALEGVTSFRQKVWARIIDPSTWTGLIYEIVQFPVGIAAFVAVITSFSVAGALIAAPFVIWASSDPLTIGDGSLRLVLETPAEALPLVPLGFLTWLLAVHILTFLSALHASWARLMLGTRARSRPASAEPWGSPPEPEPPMALLPPPDAQDSTREAAESAAASDPVDDPVVNTLTAREREVTLLLARGFSNADIAEHCYISEGTVKTHVLHILEKLNVRDRTQVAIFAYERGLVRRGVNAVNLPFRG